MPMPKGPRPVNESVYKEAARLRMSGYGYHAISRMLNRDYATVWKWIKDLPKPEKLINTPAPVESMLVENSKHSRRSVKSRIIKYRILKLECAICKNPPIWNNKPLNLRLDHINGVNNDYRIFNLRLICPNCDSQTETYRGRNKRKMVRHAGIEPATS